jgi:hypothetical protein
MALPAHLARYSTLLDLLVEALVRELSPPQRTSGTAVADGPSRNSDGHGVQFDHEARVTDIPIQTLKMKESA